MITPEMSTLGALDEQQLGVVAQSVPGGMDNVLDAYPLSPLQDGMLFHYLLNASSDPYVLSAAFELQSRAQVERLVDAIQRVIDRHTVLRSAVLWEALPRSLQVVYRRAPLPVDYRTLDEAPEPIEQIKNQLRPDQARIDLRKAPLLRLQVAEHGRGARWYGILRIHHIICDHQSFGVVLSEIQECMAGRERQLPAPVTFREYVEQSMRLDTQDAEIYFRSRLEQCDEPTAPFGLLDVHGAGREIGEAQRSLDPALAERVRRQSRRWGGGSGRLFHAAWALVVAHTSQREDVVFGTVLLAAKQRGPQVRRMLGLSVNTLPLRLQLQDATASALVEQTYRELDELLKHEAAPLTLAQRCSGMADTAPLFTSILNYRRSSPGPESVTEAGVRVVARGDAWTNYPVTLTVDDLGDGFVLTAQTDRRIDPERVTGYLEAAMRALVDALEHAPETPAMALSILPEAERRSVVSSFNATALAYPEQQVIHGLFEEQVARTPDVIAVMYEQQALTYAQLNGKANRLARYLRSKGVGPDQLVGICVERSLDMVIGLLGVLKAGGAYVPLDPNYPVERLRYMLEDAAPRVVLTQEKLTGLLPLSRGEVIVLDAEPDVVREVDETNLAPSTLALTAEKLLYVIYTSGSTGQPKGTAMEHRSMVNLIEWHRRNLPLEPATRVSQFAALSFDVAFQEVFSTLCMGGTLVLLDETVRRDARALLSFLSRQRVERVFLPPMMLQHVAECWQVTGVSPQNVRDIIAAGEALRVSPEIIAFCKHLERCRLHNHYGPTETHVVTSLTLAGDPQQWPALPDIGRPVANTQIYILDRRKQPVPVGVAGEVHIGGANLARGYLNRPELTAARFLQDPFSTAPRARMYATGDLGRWRSDGSIEYLGRNDDQVKIRGFRIEPKEIEAQLRLHPWVRDAVVIAAVNASGDRCLVAYVTHAPEGRPSTEDLRKHLEALVPEHMLPSAFVLLDGLPLTPSGKLNRRALPAPQFGAHENRHYDPPRGEVETRLAEIWRELLGIAQVSRTDHFFKLGGDSMTSLRLAVRIVERFAAQFTVAAIFQHPSLHAMAEAIEVLEADRRPPEPNRMTFEEGVV